MRGVAMKGGMMWKREGDREAGMEEEGGREVASVPGSLLKTGGGESLVTFARKAVDFQRVIIHVINEGHAYFCGKCRVSYKSVTRY